MENTDFGIFKVLYAFHDPQFIIAEIKRTDLSENYPPEKRFHWFQFNKRSKGLTRLNFVSMDKAEDKELRTFEEGGLSFDSVKACFIDKAQKQTQLLALPIKNLSVEFEVEVTKYFR